jgi:hypothetical protein
MGGSITNLMQTPDWIKAENLPPIPWQRQSKME